MAITRRGLLWLPATLLGQSGARTDAVRYADPSTEFEVLRLTDPSYTSYLPRPYARTFARRGATMLYASDRGGSMQIFTMDTKSKESRLVAPAAQLDVSTMTLTPNGRSACYLDGGELRMAAVSGGGRARSVYKATDPSFGRGMSVTADGPSALLVEGGTRLRRVGLLRGTASTVVENPAGVRDPQTRPRRASVAYRDDSGGVWLAHLDGGRNTQLKTEPGTLGPAYWSPDGKTILYLHLATKANTIREIDPDTGEDRMIAPTSGYVDFAPNSDASVFTGCSGSKAAPFVLVMVRLVKRELALCEHKSSDPSQVYPVFTPDSQRIFFQSDRHGKSAIYSMVVDKLIEKTESTEPESN